MVKFPSFFNSLCLDFQGSFIPPSPKKNFCKISVLSQDSFRSSFEFRSWVGTAPPAVQRFQCRLKARDTPNRIQTNKKAPTPKTHEYFLLKIRVGSHDSFPFGKGPFLRGTFWPRLSFPRHFIGKKGHPGLLMEILITIRTAVSLEKKLFLSSGDSRDSQEWDPFMVSFPYYSHTTPWLGVPENPTDIIERSQTLQRKSSFTDPRGWVLKCPAVTE